MSEIMRTPVIRRVAIGLDMSLTATGFCMKADDIITVETIKTNPKTAPNDLARLRYIADKVMSRIPKDVDMICMEDFFVPRNPAQINSAIRLAMLAAVMRMSLYEAGYPFFIVAASQIKKFATGKGSGIQKSIVVREVYKRWGVEAKDDNQADACAMAHLADAMLVDVPPDRPQFQRDVLKKIYADRPRYNTGDEDKSSPEEEVRLLRESLKK